MKKRIGITIAIIVPVIISCLLIWRLWQQPVSNIISVSKDAITSFSAYGMFQIFETGSSDLYSINSPAPLSNEPGEIMEILAMSEYQQDFRNLLPWGVDSVSADNNYDGRTITLSLYYQDEGSKYIALQFLSNSTVVVRTADQTNMYIYHPTNSATFYKLVDYLQTHGVLL